MYSPFSTLALRRAQHLRDHGVRVLHVHHLRLERHEHDVGICEAIDHEVGGIGEQLVICLLADVGARLAYRDADKLTPGVQPSRLSTSFGSGPVRAAAPGPR